MNDNKKISDLVNENRLTENFVSFAKFDTQSDENLAEEKTPSTESQRVFAEYLKNILENIGLSDVIIDEHSVLTATLKSNIGVNSPVVGLIAHLDTSPEASGKNVKPIIHNYVSGNITLENGVVISEKDLLPYKGHSIITSDGTTLLGADDKAGIAEIIEALTVLIENPEIKHPEIRVAFTPDEETGMGVRVFDIEKFGAKLAYTIDGDLPEVIEDESFNAFNPRITVFGKNVHTGYAKDIMINAVKIASLLVSKLPENECPEKTELKQGFYHVSSITGTPEKAVINMLVRDHEYEKAKSRLEFLKKLISDFKRQFDCEIVFEERECYHNMKKYIDRFPQVIEYAKEGIKRSGLTPLMKAIRGGTDGSQLSERGLLTPNLGAGGVNFHSVREFVSINSMKKCCENIINILRVWGEKSI